MVQPPSLPTSSRRSEALTPLLLGRSSTATRHSPTLFRLQPVPPTCREQPSPSRSFSVPPPTSPQFGSVGSPSPPPLLPSAPTEAHSANPASLVRSIVISPITSTKTHISSTVSHKYHSMDKPLLPTPAPSPRTSSSPSQPQETLTHLD
jgi:hypothetical protein